MEVKLSIIPKPREGSRTVIETKVVPAFKGNGTIDYVCGNCGTVIAEKLRRRQIRNVVVICPKCEKYNEFPDKG